MVNTQNDLQIVLRQVVNHVVCLERQSKTWGNMFFDYLVLFWFKLFSSFVNSVSLYAFCSVSLSFPMRYSDG